jgi:hypothetical protein
MLKKTILFSSLLLFFGCASKDPTTQKSAFIVFKTPSFAYADMGFIDKQPYTTKIEIYAMGQPALNFTINQSNVCISLLECLSKADFNAKFLSKYYPTGTLEAIFRALPIFKGDKLYQSSNGFTQKLQEPNKYDIEYRVEPTQSVFRDTINQIVIKVRYQ